MDVFLVPIGPESHELYCEVPEPEETVAEPPTGWFRSMAHRFREMLAAAERERRARLSGEPVEEPSGWWGKVKARTLRWAAESIAEQRLLWHLRRCREAEMGYPSDLAESAARELMRAQLSADYDRHRRWFIIDVLLFIGSGVLMIVPGPNVVAYYFAFRLVGHYLSMRGARQGLDRIAWRFRACDELSRIREIIDPDTPERGAKLREIQARLRLDHLAAFVERVTGS